MTPNQIRIIRALRLGELSQADLLKATSLGKAALSKEVKAFEGTLEKGGYVNAMSFDSPSGEEWYFSLTKKGESLAASILRQRTLLLGKKKK